MRLMVAVGYLGWSFSGSQRQTGRDDVTTVEGTVADALVEVGAVEDPEKADLRFASRTDAGVSARGNAFALDTDLGGDELLDRLVGVLPKRDVLPWGWVDVPDGFDPRQARSRWYRYHLFNDGLDLGAVQQAARAFVGEHDYAAFAKADPSRPDVETRRFVTDVDVGLHESFVVVDVKARSFLWQQVRRMVGALRAVGRGELGVEAVAAALESGKAEFDPVVAPAEGLVLVEVDHGLDWTTRPGTSERVREAVLERMVHHLTRTQVLRDLTR